MASTFTGLGLVQGLQQGRAEDRQNAELGLRARGLKLDERRQEFAEQDALLGRSIQLQQFTQGQLEKDRLAATAELESMTEAVASMVATSGREKAIATLRQPVVLESLKKLQKRFEANGGDVDVAGRLGRVIQLTQTADELALSQGGAEARKTIALRNSLIELGLPKSIAEERAGLTVKKADPAERAKDYLGILTSMTNNGNVQDAAIQQTAATFAQLDPEAAPLLSAYMPGGGLVPREERGTAETFGAPQTLSGPDGKPVVVQVGNRGTVRPLSGFGPEAGEGSAVNIQLVDGSVVAGVERNGGLFVGGQPAPEGARLAGAAPVETGRSVNIALPDSRVVAGVERGGKLFVDGQPAPQGATLAGTTSVATPRSVNVRLPSGEIVAGSERGGSLLVGGQPAPAGSQLAGPAAAAPETTFGNSLRGRALDIITELTPLYAANRLSPDQEREYHAALNEYTQPREMRDPVTGETITVRPLPPAFVGEAFKARRGVVPLPQDTAGAPTVPLPQGPGGAETTPLPSAPGLLDDAGPTLPSGETVWDMAPLVTGPIPAVGELAGRTPGMAGDIAPEITQARNTVEQLQRSLVLVLQNNPKYAEGERKAIEEDIKIEGQVFDNAGAYRNRLIGIDDALIVRQRNAEETARSRVSAEERRHALNVANAIKQFRRNLLPQRIFSAEQESAFFKANPGKTYLARRQDGTWGMFRAPERRSK